MTELFIRKSRRKCWIFLCLVLIVYTIVMWKIGKSQNYTKDIVEKIWEVDYVPPPAPDRRFLIDLSDFDYLINQKSCRQLGVKPKFIILIHSAPRKRENRDNIRQTWGGWKIDHRVLFLLGTVESQDLQREIQTESDFFQDIVQGNFVDTYRNLSYKHIMAMKWATEFCPETQFIFKSDDDIFVNTPFILKFVNRVSNTRDFMFCVISWKPGVIRDERSKWYVSPEEYPNATYPVYCPGCGVLLTTDVAQKLHKAAETTPFFWVDDVYVLGTLREKIKTRITATGNLHMGSRIADEIFTNKRNITDADHFMFSFELKNNQIKQLWEVVKVSLNKGYYN
ncbi:beta-1,3-galactosyltransferase 5-like [Phlebotomus argentipes]|uniref:beta-1,3-galactosyltransferase 5-like n=1 Tax=Phlebotomus argentipes TaxID=94469 RepID=UPI002892A0E9|nr:beta-1,3-galactosyltransferase 5-like [Phlebotomus argentipes]